MSNKEQLQNNNVQLASLIQTLQSKAIGGGGGGGAPADWNASEGEPGHVLNRTHYEYVTNGYLLEETTLTGFFDSGATMYELPDFDWPTEGVTYTVHYNGTNYECTVSNVYGMVVMGNASFMGLGNNTNEPFFFLFDPEMCGMFTFDGSTTATISIYGPITTVHKIDSKYINLDIMNGEAAGSLVTTNASRMYYGENSIAFGLRASASGKNAVAIGYGANAAAEGAVAIGAGTNAVNYYQTVLGRYNTYDFSKAFILGNGTDDLNTANIHTIDWDGNGWFAGAVEGTAMILKSPNGTRYQITVDDSGNLTAAAVTE